MTTSTTTAAWPEGVIARYLNLAGAPVDVVEQSDYYGEPTETHAACSGCGATHTVDWDWVALHDEFGVGPGPDFDEAGQHSTEQVRAWAQSHAERCQTPPRTPDAA